MAHFDSHTLSHLKKLCKIECTHEEELDILSSLTRVLGYIESLKEVDTENIPPCNFVLRGMLKTVLRDDLIEGQLSHEKFLANAPEQIGGMIRVPIIIKDHE